jgi:hypothetical protein
MSVSRAMRNLSRARSHFVGESHQIGNEKRASSDRCIAGEMPRLLLLLEPSEIRKINKTGIFPTTLTHPEPWLLIASHHEAIHDAGRS